MKILSAFLFKRNCKTQVLGEGSWGQTYAYAKPQRDHQKKEKKKKKKEDKQLSEVQGQYHLVVITFPPSRMEPISSRTKP